MGTRLIFRGQMEVTVVDLEKASEKEIPAEVRARYTELLEQIPALKKAYTDAGGKFFLPK